MKPNASRAFTLTELMLVLALIVILTAVAWPVMTRPLAAQRLRSAADLVGAEWGRARFQAMSSGQVVAFRYAKDGRQYLTEGQSSSELIADGSGSSDFEGYEAELEAETSQVNQQYDLPDGVFFADSEINADMRSVELDSDPDQAPDQGVALSDRIYFYPDGTSSTARLLLTNQYNDCVELSLRGLTGVVNIGQLQSLGGQQP